MQQLGRDPEMYKIPSIPFLYNRFIHLELPKVQKLYQIICLDGSI